jgi:hypothetical protein
VKNSVEREGLREVGQVLGGLVIKVALFRSLFRGWEDVFARRWGNMKAGTSPKCRRPLSDDACEEVGTSEAR